MVYIIQLISMCAMYERHSHQFEKELWVGQKSFKEVYCAEILIELKDSLFASQIEFSRSNSTHLFRLGLMHQESQEVRLNKKMSKVCWGCHCEE